MSAPEVDPRFPGDAQIAPPSDNANLASQSGPTAENPGNVHPVVDPKSDPNPPKQEGRSIFSSIENPYALREAMTKLESSLDEIISLFQGEGDTLGKDGGFTKGKEAITKFKKWKEELEQIKRGQE